MKLRIASRPWDDDPEELDLPADEARGYDGSLADPGAGFDGSGEPG